MEGDQLLLNPTSGHQYSPRNARSTSTESNSSPDETEPCRGGGQALTFDQVLTRIGVGRFHLPTIAVLGLGNAADAVEIMSIGYALTAYPHITSFERGFLTAAIFAGMLVGGLVLGTLADRIGRKPALLLSLGINGAAALLSAFSPHVSVLIGLRIVAGIGVGGSVPCVFTLAAEVTPPHHRGALLNAVAWMWMAGSLFAAGTAWYVIEHLGLSWRVYLAIASAPATICLVLTSIVVPESPRWLYKRGRLDAAIAVLRTMARKNRVDASWLEEALPAPVSAFPIIGSDDGAEAARLSINGIVSAAAETKDERPHRPLKASSAPDASLVSSNAAVKGIPYREAFRALFEPNLRRTTALLMGVWFTLSFASYGLLVWIPTLFKDADFHIDPYQNAILVAAANLPGNIVSWLLIDRLGRRKLLTGGTLMACGCAIGFALANRAWIVVLSACAFNMFGIMGWNSLDCLSTESFPTQIRSVGMGVMAASGRVGSMVAQFVNSALIDSSTATILFVSASSMLIGSACAAMLPFEPADAALADDLDEVDEDAAPHPHPLRSDQEAA
eukprot:CAMPEP_0196770934 /NCGR_PEP_ID=MMETSP1104-20130614/1417_1 /TAXON_ID=33652 /ORGANISM="Cafeteria sp., Strain Caron Lab Isolate" /LENGTH=558 /DNA_ID=CAMNT_0042141049 /DNA_START=43 /DNA_END=1719 /DNA_ORIENTATION=+